MGPMFGFCACIIHKNLREPSAEMLHVEPRHGRDTVLLTFDNFKYDKDAAYAIIYRLRINIVYIV